MKTILILLLAAMAARPILPSSPAGKPAVPPPPPTDRELVLKVAASQIGVTEKTGRNDGPQVEAYIASVGLNPKGGYPYCACFNFWVGREALASRNPYPKSAWSPDHVKGGTRVTAETKIKGGETFGIWFASKGRIAHTGLVERREGGNLITIEANTSANAAVGSAADRDGQGVYRKRRPWRTVHSVKDWLNHP